jgi:hypothetical protein
MKTGPNALGIAENESECAKFKNGPDALGTAGNESGTLGTVKNESGHAKKENETQHSRYQRKRVRARKI